MTVTTALDFAAMAISAFALFECARTRRLLRLLRMEVDKTMRMLDAIGGKGDRILFQSPDFPPAPRQRRSK